MPGRGKKGNRAGGRGRGGASARGGRRGGRGTVAGGGGGRGRNRELIPSAIGYVYRPHSNVDEFNDDFRIYGQFSSDEIDSETEARQLVPQKKAIEKSHQKKDYLGFVKEDRPSFGSNYDDNYDVAMDRAGLGASSSSGQQHAAVHSIPQFAKGKSKYLKKVLFTRSSSSIDLTKVEDALIKEQTPVAKQMLVQASMSSLSLDDATVDEKLSAKKELWSILKGQSLIADAAAPVESIDYVEVNAAALSTPNDETRELLTNESPLEQMDSSLKEEDTTTALDNTSSGEDDTFDEEIDQCASDDDQDISSQFEDYEELDDTEEDELLEEDMLIMQDYMENIELQEGDDLNELLGCSAIPEFMPEFDFDDSDDDIYDYSILDRSPTAREVSIMEEETLKFTKKKNKTTADQNTRKKVGHRNRDDESIVDPEIFGQTLKAALADVPPGLRPGMRKWYEKQQRKEDRKQKKEEAKAHKKEMKKNGKGKAKYVQDEDLTNQMAKIDERIRGFVQDASISSFQFAPMAIHVRRQLHVLAAAYNLKSKSTGAGGSRCTIVTKTPTTYIPNDRANISRFLSDIQTNMNEQNRIIGKNKANGFRKGKKKFINSSKKNQNGTFAPKDKRGDSQFPNGPSHGTVVAFDAAPISESNVGHRMLAAMGWKQGEALGSKSEGIVAPIEVIIRKKGRGLGS